MTETIKWYYSHEVITIKPLKKKVSITLDTDIITRLKSAAEQDDRSFSQYINLVLREHLVNNQTEIRKNDMPGK